MLIKRLSHPTINEGYNTDAIGQGAVDLNYLTVGYLHTTQHSLYN